VFQGRLTGVGERSSTQRDATSRARHIHCRLSTSFKWCEAAELSSQRGNIHARRLWGANGSRGGRAVLPRWCEGLLCSNPSSTDSRGGELCTCKRRTETWSLSDPARNASGLVFVLGEAEGPQPQSLLERPRPGVWYGEERACGKAWHCRASFGVHITLWFQGLSSCALQSP
jgi:hypothetical protein